MAIVKIKEIIGISPKSFEDALQNAVNSVCQEKKNVTGAKVTNQNVCIENGKIVEYNVNLKVAYLWDKDSHR